MSEGNAFTGFPVDTIGAVPGPTIVTATVVARCRQHRNATVLFTFASREHQPLWKCTMPRHDAYFPGRAPVDAYGNGGFRFADMSHRGSLLLLPSGIYGWEPATVADLEHGSFARVLAEGEAVEFLLLGTGATLQFLPPPLARSLRSEGLRIETMDTGAAARTYNILLAENRPVAAALIAVDDVRRV